MNKQNDSGCGMVWSALISLLLTSIVSQWRSYFDIQFLTVGFFASRFHTYDYARHFVSACTRILGLEGTPEGVEDQGKLTRVAAVYQLITSLYLCTCILVALLYNSEWVFSELDMSPFQHPDSSSRCQRFVFGRLKLQFPIGIDSERFIRALELPQVQDHIKELKERFAGRKVRPSCFI